MANKRNQAKKATKAARDAAFRASHAHQIEAIRSKATPQRPASHQPSQKDHLPLDSRSSKLLEAPPAFAGNVSLDEDMPNDLLKTTSNAISTIQVSASSVQRKIAAPAAGSGANADNPNPDTPCTKDNYKDAATNAIAAKSEQLPAPADKHGAEPPKRFSMRKLLVGAAGIALGVATHVAASAATISAVAAAPPACKTPTSSSMLGGFFSKALALAVLPVSLVSAIAA